ncbi:MAG TPA: hypothetical protein ENI98_11225 [Gammaproteobacteria bacterium]|nr:hypothetical protein [Gammaproteobacteria bacterium]
MVNKNTSTKQNTNKTSRLGHDPFEDVKISTDKNETSKSENTETDKKDMTGNSNPETLSFPSRFSIATAEEIYKRMSYHLSQEQTHIELDPEKTTSIDTSAIQLLYAFIAQAKISGKTLHWKSRSEIIENASRILNIHIFYDTDQT